MYKLQYIGSYVLNSVTIPITNINNSVKDIIFYMKNIMIEKDGVGLAANQIGINMRIFVYTNNRPKKNKTNFSTIKTFINPSIEILNYSEMYGGEGCLSIPGNNLFTDVKRYKVVKVTGLNENGDQYSTVGRGLLSHIFQHEIDHLNGMFYIDHLSDNVKNKYRLLSLEYIKKHKLR